MNFPSWKNAESPSSLYANQNTLKLFQQLTIHLRYSRYSLLNKPSLGIVGARNASAAGRVFAREISRDLEKAGIVISWRLARGIDTAAHDGALDSGTIVVVAGGIDIVYPRRNGALYEKIVQSGTVISEQPFGISPTARHFPRRNRLISGLSFGVLDVRQVYSSPHEWHWNRTEKFFLSSTRHATRAIKEPMACYAMEPYLRKLRRKLFRRFLRC